MEVDTNKHRSFCRPCDYDHVKWCIVIGYEVCTRKISELKPIGNKQRKKLEQLLKWLPKPPDNVLFLRQPGVFNQSQNGLSSFQCWYDYDSKGVSLPKELEDPEVLTDLVQAKKCQAFSIEQWLGTHSKRYEGEDYGIVPEEYLDHPGMDVQLFQGIFGRPPDKLTVQRFVEHGILSKMPEGL